MTLAEYVARQQARVDEALQRWVPSVSTLPESIHKAMRYSLFAGGKRVRPILCMAAAEAVSDSPDWHRIVRLHARIDPHLFADSRRSAGAR